MGFNKSSGCVEFQLLNLNLYMGIISRFCVTWMRHSQPWRRNQMKLPFTLWGGNVHEMSGKQHTSIHTSMLLTLWRSHLLVSSDGILCRCCNTTSTPQQQLSLAFLKCIFIWIDRKFTPAQERLLDGLLDTPAWCLSEVNWKLTYYILYVYFWGISYVLELSYGGFPIEVFLPVSHSDNPSHWQSVNVFDCGECLNSKIIV